MSDTATLGGAKSRQGDLFSEIASLAEPGQSASKRRLLLVDGHALAYRGYYALIRQNLRTTTGEPTGAVHGFVNMLLLATDKLKPNSLAVCFDLEGKTFRDEKFADYKANRRPMPEELRSQIDIIRDVVRALGLPIYEVPGYEADDVIATIALLAAQANFDVKILTGDRDIFQIVQPGICVVMPKVGATELEAYDSAGVEVRMGLRPDQIVDYKGLAGDAADNIPGVPGIGDKTAVLLLKEFASFEGLYANLELVKKPKLKEALELHRATARMSYELARIDTAAPLKGLDWAHCELTPPNIASLTVLLERLEFKAMLRDLPRRLGALFPAGEKATGSPDPERTLEGLVLPGTACRPLSLKTRVVDSTSALENLVARLRTSDTVAFDTETDGLSPLACNLVGLSFACGPADASVCDAYYLPVGHRQGQQLPIEQVLETLRPIFEDPAIPKLAHHAKFDCHVLSRYGINVVGPCDDTLIAAYVVDAGGYLGLKDLALNLLGYRMTPIVELIGKAGPKQLTMDQVDIAAAAPYAAADAAVTLELHERLQECLRQEGNLDLYRELEIPLIPVLRKMEHHGVRLDTVLLTQLSQDLAVRVAQTERAAWLLVGHEFNLNSPKQLENLLFDRLQLPSGRKTKTGRSTDAAVLEDLQAAHPIVATILEFRQLTKLKNTYVDVLPTYINARTGCVHTSYNQHVAATGRLSSDRPNLQNIPIRTDLGREIRRAFIPCEPGNLILAADYSQIELRILAHVADDSAFKKAFFEDLDIHTATAAQLFGGPLDQVNAEMRRRAKAVNFGVAYGQTPFGLSRALGITQREAKEFIDSFRSRYAGVHRYTVETVIKAHQDGYVTTLLGRKRKLPGLQSANRQERDFAARAAINTPIQGSAADLIKLAMLRVSGALEAEGFKTAMVLQVHDELVFEAPPQEVEAVKLLIRREMEGAMSLTVPLKVDMSVGATWCEAK